MTQTQITDIDKKVLSALNERQRRIYSASLAKKFGYGGQTKVHKELGVDYGTLRRGMKDLEEPPMERVRLPGGGRKKIIDQHPEISDEVDKIIKRAGHPMKHIKWTHLSIDKITEKLQAKGYAVHKNVVNRLLWKKKYKLRRNQKELHKKSDPDRDAQFNYIDEQADKYLTQGDIVTSIDAKKTEKLGNFKNEGATYSKPGEATKVKDHDFGDRDESGRTIKAIPFGAYDVKLNKGYVNVGVDHNTSEFAAESIRRWYNKVGKIDYPKSKNLMITADSGGANGNRVRMWKWQLQLLANETGLAIHVFHYPSGTSKWNKIEHRMFSFITKNWQGEPLKSYGIVLGFIEGTTTKTGLSVTAELDSGTYDLKQYPTKEQMGSMNIKPHKFRPDWNYSIYPQA